jgi:hypothetical protein
VPDSETRPLSASGNPAAQRLAAMVKQALKLGDVAAQHRRGRAIETGRDVVLVEHDLLVGPDLDDARGTEANVPGPLVGLEGETKPQLADLDRGDAFGPGNRIAGLEFVRAIARHRLLGVALDEILGARLARRQRQIDDAVPGVLGHLERRRMVGVVGQAEGRAVLQNAVARGERELAERQQVVVDRQFPDAPGVRPQAADLAADQLFDVAVVLLKMLWLQKQTFGPDDFVVPGHVTPCC